MSHRFLPHVGHFTKGSRWRFVSACRTDDRSGHAQKGATFTVSGAISSTGEIPVSDTTLYGYAKQGTRYTSGKATEASVLHNYIYRHVELIDQGPNPITYVVRLPGRGQGFDVFLAGKENVFSIAQARFFQSVNPAIKALLRKTGFERGFWSGRSVFSSKGYDIVAFDARTGEYEYHCSLSDVFDEFLNLVAHEFGPSDRKSIVMLAPVLNNRSFVMGKLDLRGSVPALEQVDAREKAGAFKTLGRVSTIIIFPDIDHALAAKMALSYPLSIREFSNGRVSETV